MKNFGRLFASMIFFVLMFSSSFFCLASYPNDWLRDKDQVFKMAIEQDKFILLFIGKTSCPICLNTNAYFNNSAWPLKKILEENYIIWYSSTDAGYRQPDVLEYSAAYEEESRRRTMNTPWIFVINPNEPGKNVKSAYGNLFNYNLLGGGKDDVRNVGVLQDFLTVDLLSGSSLKWYDDRDEAFRLAKQQNKFIFKLEGNGMSPNSQQVMKLLNDNTLKKMLQDNYILWYDNQGKPAIAPDIAIIYPETADVVQHIYGEQDVTALKELLESYTVFNESTASNPIVTVRGNVLQISNRIMNEQVQVFTLGGQRIASVRKSDYSAKIDLSPFPKGALVVRSSSGWHSKIVVQ